MFKKFVFVATAVVLASAGASAQEQVLNLYSARHYSTDEALYTNFTKATGIKINRIDSDDAGVVTRLKAEGAASPTARPSPREVTLVFVEGQLIYGDADFLSVAPSSAGLGVTVTPATVVPPIPSMRLATWS